MKKASFVRGEKTIFEINKQYSIGAWVKNVSNTYYITSGLSTQTRSTVMPGAPRTYGISAGYKF